MRTFERDNGLQYRVNENGEVTYRVNGGSVWRESVHTLEHLLHCDDTHETTTLEDRGDETVKGFDPVDKPEHYASGGIELLDFFEASFPPDEFRGFLKGNIMKYAFRYGMKNGVQDLKKAEFYNDRLIKFEEKMGDR